MLNKVFISYTSDDEEVALSIERRLHAQGFPVEVHCHPVELGDEIDSRIREEMRSCSLLVIILSPASLKSKWVSYEIGLATDRTAPLRIILYLAHKALDLPDYLRPFPHAASLNELSDFFTKAEFEPDTQQMRKFLGLDSNLATDAETRILIVGQTCWDDIVLPSGKCYDRIGGSAYYATKAIQHVAEIMHRRVSIDVWVPVGSDYKHRIEPRFDSTFINCYFVAQEKTLRFKNQYVSDSDWTRRTQEVLQIPDGRICAGNAPSEVKVRLSQGSYYQFALLLPLTPHDFTDIAADMIPFLIQNNPHLQIGLDLQGLLRDVHPGGERVDRRLSEVLPKLLKQHAVCCLHANIDEGLFFVRELADRHGVSSTVNELSPTEIALELCRHGIRYVGLTDGGRGSWIAWQSPDGRLHAQHNPTADITSVVGIPHATGAGDTWFGIFAYALFGRRFDPISAGLLATQFATIKCTCGGALGERSS